MTTLKQRHAARRNVRKARAAWQAMSHRQRALAQPEGRMRQKPGMGEQGNYYRINVRPKRGFVTFRAHDLGQSGHIERIAGKRRSGSWDTAVWLISKKDAHIEHGRLIPDTPDARAVLDRLGSAPVHVKGDIFQANPRPNIPEREKPTAAQRRASRENITKAQAARRDRRG